MNKLTNILKDQFNRYSFLFVGIQGIISWIFFIAILFLKPYIDSFMNKDLGGIGYIIWYIHFIATYFSIYLLFLLLLYIKLLKKEQKDPNFRFRNKLQFNLIFQIFSTALFTLGSISWIPFILLAIIGYISDFNTILLYHICIFFIPIIIFVIWFFILKSTNKSWIKILLYCIGIILSITLIWIYKNNDTYIIQPYLGIPFTIMLYWIYKKN